jgi:hypothetical protein
VPALYLYLSMDNAMLDVMSIYIHTTINLYGHISSTLLSCRVRYTMYSVVRHKPVEVRAEAQSKHYTALLLCGERHPGVLCECPRGRAESA